jgi:hypothetical protein
MSKAIKIKLLSIYAANRADDVAQCRANLGLGRHVESPHVAEYELNLARAEGAAAGAREELICAIIATDNRPREAAEELADRWIAGEPIHASWPLWNSPATQELVDAARAER